MHNHPPISLYQSWRKEVIERDFYGCRACGEEREEELRVVLLEPVGTAGSFRYVPSNGVTLCRACSARLRR